MITRRRIRLTLGFTLVAAIAGGRGYTDHVHTPPVENCDAQLKQGLAFLLDKQRKTNNTAESDDADLMIEQLLDDIQKGLKDKHYKITSDAALYSFFTLQGPDEQKLLQLDKACVVPAANTLHWLPVDPDREIPRMHKVSIERRGRSLLRDARVV